MTNPNTPLTVAQAMSGQRLDRFLAAALPGCSLRAARRLTELGLALVDGRARAQAYKLLPGQVVTVAQPQAQAQAQAQEAELAARLVSSGDGFAALYKPAGLNTARLAGSPAPSLEDLLPELLPQGALLVNRLDRATSGIVLAALSPADATRFRDLENHGLVDKRYLALAVGRIPAALTLDYLLDTANRAKTKVLPGHTPNPLRATCVTPLAYADGFTLVEARIAKGARHQIRAHLAACGHPLAGDTLYGGPPHPCGLMLHHWRISFEGFQARILPDWQDAHAVLDTLGDQSCAL